MKQVHVLLLTLTLAAGLGCAAKTTVTAPIPGAINSFDSVSYQTLMDAQAAINAVKADVAAGKVTLTATQKTVLNQAIQDYDLAQAAWQAYHAGSTSNTVALTSAINQIVADIAALATQIQGGK
jgi:hypothetical protein